MSNKSLIERLKFWRAERPDEWMVDEFIRDAEKLEQERNELAAQVNKLRETIELIVKWDSHTIELAVNCGSNGVRDFYRRIAESSLTEQPPTTRKTRSSHQRKHDDVNRA